MKSNIKKYALLHGVLLLYSFVAIFSKLASGYDFLSPGFVLTYGIAMFLIFVYAILWQQVLKLMPLSTAFANKAITIIWGIIWGMLFFHEKLTWNMGLGAVIIIIGIFCVVSEDE